MAYPSLLIGYIRISQMYFVSLGNKAIQLINQTGNRGLAPPEDAVHDLVTEIFYPANNRIMIEGVGKETHAAGFLRAP